MEHTLYILFSHRLDKFYVGYTSGPKENRLRRHLNTHSGFTSHAKDWQLVFQESFKSKTDAIAREKEIKSWKSRAKILILINSSLGDSSAG